MVGARSRSRLLALINFLLGRTKKANPKKRKTSEKPEIHSTKLNNELNGNM